MKNATRYALLGLAFCVSVGAAFATQQPDEPPPATLPVWAAGDFVTTAPSHRGRVLRVEPGQITFSAGAPEAQVLPVQAINFLLSSGPDTTLQVTAKDGETLVPMSIKFRSENQEIRLATMPEVAWHKRGAGEALAAAAPASTPAPAPTPEPVSAPAPAATSAPMPTMASGSAASAPRTEADSAGYWVCCVNEFGKPTRYGMPTIVGVWVPSR